MVIFNTPSLEEIQNIKSELLHEIQKWLSSNTPESKYKDVMLGMLNVKSSALNLFILAFKNNDGYNTT
jgi:hypothetical protein